jgi:mycofactocin system creatininase family protein
VSGTPVRLAELTWPQVAARAAAGAWLAVPVGSTEQHGPHLPLSTDTDIAVALATALARSRDDVLVAPAAAYGASGEHAGFAGTLSIGQTATGTLLVELVRSATLTFPRVLLVVGHGGNAAPVNAATAQLRAEGRDVLAWAPRFPGDPHAGRTETSLMLALRPEAVRRERARAGVTESLAALMPRLREGGVLAVSPNGVLGDPAGASAEQGRVLLAAALTDLRDRVAQWRGET